MDRTSRDAWESRVAARVIERFMGEMDWFGEPRSGAATRLRQARNAAAGKAAEPDYDQISALEVHQAAVKGRVALAHGDYERAAVCAKRALGLNRRSSGAVRLRGQLRFLAGVPGSSDDFDASLVYADQPWASNIADRRTREADGERYFEELSRFLATPRDAAVDDGFVARVAPILRELVVSQRIMRSFAKDMDWPGWVLHTFAALNPAVAANAESWLCRVYDSLPAIGVCPSRSADVLLAGAYEALRAGAPPEAVEAVLPREPAAAGARVAFIRGEAALRQGQTDRALREFTRLAALAPHVTVGHRRLGQIAVAAGDWRRAARHFEAAAAVYNQPWTAADLPDDMPQLVTGIGGRFDIYRFRGALYAVPWTPRSKGIAVVANRLIHVFDTPAYRVWARYKRISVLNMLRTLLVGLRESPLGEPFHAMGRHRLIAPVLKRVAALLGRRRKKRRGGATGPGRLMSIVLRIARMFKGTPIERLARSAPARFLARTLVEPARAARDLGRLVVLRAVFQARELPSDLRAGTLEDLIERMGRFGARTRRPAPLTGAEIA